MSSDNTLPSGIYVIHSVLDSKNDERLVMVPDSDSRDATGQIPVKTQRDRIYKWAVTYYERDDDYTIEAVDAELYIITSNVATSKYDPVSKDTHVSYDVVLAQASQRFKISPIVYQNTVYYEIKTTDLNSGIFQCEGDNKQVEVVSSNSREVQVRSGDGGSVGNFSIPFDPRSFLWDFEECSPYTLSSATNTYFESDQTGELLARFGLKDKYTWDQLWEGIDDLNSKAKGAAFYKLFLLGRHGHNEHNIKSALGADYDGFDAALTQVGCVQAGLVRAVWDSARSENPGIGIPQLSYCSPMRRALATNTISFSSELSAEEDDPSPKMTTTVVENCRERMYTDDSEKRHSRHWIKKMFPNFDAHGLSEHDLLWNHKLEESFPHFRARARNVLDNVFAHKNLNPSVKFVSITAHHEWSAVFMEVLGQPGTMDYFKLAEGGVLPVIVQYTPPAK